MSARDTYHSQVKNALVKDGWTITDDPLTLKYGKKDLYVDLGAEQLLGAEKEQRKIAVEIKSFIGASEMRELEHALGQYLLYHDILEQTLPDYRLYLAVSNSAYARIFEEPIGKLFIDKHSVRLLVFDIQAEVIEQWIP